MGRSANHGAERTQMAWTWMQRALLAVALGLLTWVAAAWLDHSLRERAALGAFVAAGTFSTSSGAGVAEPTGLGERLPVQPPSEAAERNPDALEPGGTLAVLDIPAIHLVAPILDGTDAFTLNHGVGRIRGTALPGHGGNIALAGHRDSYFRGLRHLKRGDQISLRTHGGVDTYTVNRLEVVAPEDVSVLQATEDASLTLVTCYPFHFLGRAPQRFVVTANRTHHSAVGLKTPDTRSIPQPSSSTKEEL